jgi:pantoate--beta-alanine ligase
MQTAKTIKAVRAYVAEAKRNGKSVGYVATMGFLHEGHMSLVDTARSENDIVIVSVFVNPLQFGPNEDFDAYPRDLFHDTALLESHNCDMLFAPSVEEMYPSESLTYVQVNNLGEGLCGKTRPTHFRGVTTVVSKLLNIVQPSRAYFGQKDGQQLAIIRRMVNDLNMPVEIVGVPIVREEDGLARSSRNIYLSPEVRPHATILYRTLEWVKREIETGERNANKLLQEMRTRLSREPFVTLDYAEIVDLNTLQPISVLDGDFMAAIAAYVGKARLIDNIQIHLSESQSSQTQYNSI